MSDQRGPTTDPRQNRDPNHLHGVDHVASYEEAPWEAPPPPVQNLRVIMGQLLAWAGRCRDFRELKMSYDAINTSKFNDRPIEIVDDIDNRQIIVRWKE